MVVAYFNFDNSRSQALTVKVALSAVSTEGARKNLAAEVGGMSFEDVYTATRASWQRELGIIDCHGTDDQRLCSTLRYIIR